jgi:hypothetical protein
LLVPDIGQQRQESGVVPPQVGPVRVLVDVAHGSILRCFCGECNHYSPHKSRRMRLRFTAESFWGAALFWSEYFTLPGWNGRPARSAGPLARQQVDRDRWRWFGVRTTVCHIHFRSPSRRPAQAGRLFHPLTVGPGVKYPGWDRRCDRPQFAGRAIAIGLDSP